MLLEVQENKNEEKNKNIWTDNPFYFGDLEYSGIFDFLEKIEEKHIEEALSLVTETMEKIIILNKDNRDSRDAFKIGDGFALYDTDFFALKLRQKKHLSHNDDVRDLMAISKNLLSRILSNNPEKTRTILNTYITTLPDSQAMWRFRLFLFSLNTDIFSKEIKNAIFRIFEVKNPHDLTMGPEYYHLLQKTFLHLSKKTRREYIELVFKKLIGIKAKELYKSDVLKIFSSIYKELTEEDKNKAKEYLGRSLANEYNPEPLIGSIRGGFVKSQSIISAEELALMSVTDIAKKLCEEWDPKKLTRRDEFGDDFLSYDADGLSKAIQEDMAKRLQKYIKNAPLFYDKENLDEHYTYSFFNSVREIIRENKTDLSIDWDGLFTLFSIFIDPSQEKSIISGKCERRGSIWLAGWDAVHSAVADLLKELLALRENKVSIIDFNKYRNQLFAVIEYLSEHPNPDPQSEVCTPREDYSDRKDGKIKYDCSDPFTHAINSVRGKTFDALVRFMERDSKRFPKKASVKISPDVKKLYENILSQENTRAIMFLLGHYLPSFYFRDKKWTKKLFDRLFNFEPSKRDLSLAAWEGYLTNNLYYELFQELEEYYSKAMKMNRDDYTPREYFKDLDEALANHIALGFMHFSEFTLKSELFLQFWKEKSIKRQKEFVSFVGRYAISRNQAEDWLKKNRIDVKKIENLWNWILGANLEREIYETFGYWIDAEGENFKPKWQSEHILETLKKTDGKIEWDNELQQALPALAKVSPKNTIEILKLYLLNYLAVKTEDQGWIHIDDNMLDVFKVLYNNPDTKQETRNLVSALLPYGNGLFWRLEDALK
ncbi:MAG: hypothetical protein NTU76_00870 [Candidatus Taylorbacteria bacterium]|nr:hypothetical protein [Candidatus Taylorbacteria bacterium]